MRFKTTDMGTPHEDPIDKMFQGWREKGLWRDKLGKVCFQDGCIKHIFKNNVTACLSLFIGTFIYCIHTYFICLTIVLFPDSPAPERERE